MTAAKFQGLPPEAERSLQARFDRLERQIAALTTTPPNLPGLIESDYTAQEGQTLFFAAPTTGSKLLLPAPRGLNRSACIGLVFTTTAPVTISCAGGSVNGAATLVNRSAGSYWAVCDGGRGWFVAPNADGAVFNGAVSLGTLQLVSSASGTLDITLLANATRLLISSSGDTNLNTISGCSDGRLLIVEHIRGSGSGNLVVNHSSLTVNAIACPGDARFIVGDRGGFTLIGRGTTANWKLIQPKRHQGTIQTEAGGGTQNNYSLPDAAEVLFVTANTTFTGFVRPGGNNDGDRFFIQADAGVSVTLPFNSGSSSAGNRVAGANAQDVVVPSRGLIQLVHRSLLWRIQSIGVDPFQLTALASNIAVPFWIRVAVTAGTPGTADDVTIYNANAPFAFRILDVLWLDATAIALSSVQLRDTSGGGGAALSSVLTAAVTGTARNNDTATRTVALNGSVFLRRSDRGVAGEILIQAIRT